MNGPISDYLIALLVSHEFGTVSLKVSYLSLQTGTAMHKANTRARPVLKLLTGGVALVCAALSIHAPAWANSQINVEPAGAPEPTLSGDNVRGLIDALAEDAVFESLRSQRVADSATSAQQERLEKIQRQQAAKAFKSDSKQPQRFEPPDEAQPTQSEKLQRQQAAKAFKSNSEQPQRFEPPDEAQPTQSEKLQRQQAAKAFKSGLEQPRQFRLPKNN